MALAFVREAHAERGDRPPAQGRGGHQRVAARERAHTPGRIGSQVPRAVGDHDHLGLEQLLRREQPGPHRDRLELPPEGLPARDPAIEQSDGAELVHEPGEPAGEGRAIRHQVDDPCVRRALRARRDRRDHRVQRRTDHRRLGETLRRLQERRVRLLDARDRRLEWRVPGLHHVAGRRLRGSLAPFDRDDQMHAARPQPEIHRRRVEDHGVPRHHVAAHRWVRHRGRHLASDLDLELLGSLPGRRDTEDDPSADVDHGSFRSESTASI